MLFRSEKPEGLFKDTLYFSARLEPTATGQPLARLGNGEVQALLQRETAEKLDAAGAAMSGDAIPPVVGRPEPEGPDGEVPLELRHVGTFVANEMKSAEMDERDPS